ncbi:MAG: amidase [Alphaproteobacteria bacterium]
MPELHELNVREAAAGIAGGTFTSQALTEACLARIAAREPDVQAFIHLDPDAALAQAKARDAEPPRGPLHGVPVGLKDIIDTADMPTGYGSPIYDGHQPKSDAAVTAFLRAAGAVIVGKTVTTEFAGPHPGKTRNPHNPAHTPGGSSSGSAAAVGAGMVPLAFGSQTAGSVIRPASFCGAVGYKSTFGQLPTVGMKVLASTMDTLGTFTRAVADIATVRAALIGAPADVAELSGPPRIALCHTPMWDQADGDSQTALESAGKALADAGAEVTVFELPASFDGLVEAHLVAMRFEVRNAFGWELDNHRDKLSDDFMAMIDGAGTAAAYTDLLKASEHRAEAAQMLPVIFNRFDAMLVPSAPGEAPKKLDFTGDAIMNRIWSYLGVPCVSLPFATGGNGLPVGVQLVGAQGDDEKVLSVAAWAEARL